MRHGWPGHPGEIDGKDAGLMLLRDLAVIMLEPEGNDSLFAWGFFPEVLQRTEYIEGYVIAPLAEQMLAEDESLKAAFEERLASDESFARSLLFGETSASA